MKKHAEALAQVKSEDIATTITTLRADISALSRGIQLGDVQNYKVLGAKKKELARLLTRKSKEERETK
jgi:ribosomal protein L29